MSRFDMEKQYSALRKFRDGADDAIRQNVEATTQTTRTKDMDMAFAAAQTALLQGIYRELKFINDRAMDV